MARRNPLLTVVTNPPEMLGQVHSITYRHALDGKDYVHEFGPSVDMRTLDDGYLSIRHGSADVLHRDFDGQTFLVNPPRRKTMARKLPPRVQSGKNKGQFRKRAKSSPRKRKTATRRRNSPAANPGKRRAPARRNAPRRGGRITVRKVTRNLTQGAMDAALILVGKAGARSVPAFLPNLPKEGNIGLAVQALVAVALGLAADMVLPSAQAKMILAGGLTAPVETLVVSFNVPFLADALAPVTASEQLSAYYGYVQPPQIAPADGVGAYVHEGADLAMGGYDYALDA
ncbi:hypothetical protein LCGC14_0877570 [marine sediment metagenome]|uniref:Uncharacterized protein n=1 Tax=marine sediment metagenome TaxID=412755 RepID=A0A0F9RMI4_9ZZZZ